MRVDSLCKHWIESNTNYCSSSSTFPITFYCIKGIRAQSNLGSMAGVEFQVFEGVSCNLHPWISTLEDQFARDDYSDMDKLALAVYFLGGKAESFVHQREEIKYFETWDELKSSLIRMFGERDDPERIRLQTERDISTHNWLVSLKIRNADAIQEMWMPISSVSESQVESASVPAKLLDEHRIIPQNESIQVLNPNLESSLTKED